MFGDAEEPPIFFGATDVSAFLVKTSEIAVMALQHHQQLYLSGRWLLTTAFMFGDAEGPPIFFRCLHCLRFFGKSSEIAILSQQGHP